MKSVAIVRSRGQLTIPDAIRDMVTWLQSDKAVTVSVEAKDKITITPYNTETTSTDWEIIWKKLDKISKFKNKGQGNLSTFILQDRDNH